MSMTIHEILKEYWGYDAFRPLQQNIIESVIHQKDTLAILPTGGGKSVCYQVPGMFLPGLCLVISPLIALMKDQVYQLKKRNITAFAVYAGMTRQEVQQTMQVARESNCKFLYISPERLSAAYFQSLLQHLPVSMIAIDEAHCISQWGYDFRPSYLKIAAIRELFPSAPLIALTASATPVVQEDICEKLTLQQPAIFKKGFERPNLSYRVKETSDKINAMVQLLQYVKGTAIIYCRNRRKTRQIAELLLQQGIDAHYYHAGLPADQRDQKQEDWIKNKTRVMVCTNAFGMGIDKPDVRLVIHADLPDCIENYYQEAGRAGRDEQKAWAVLLYDQQDITQLEQQVDIRFPELPAIRKMYISLMNHLQIPVQHGQGNYYPIDLQEFVRYFQLDAQQITYGLKLLEQEGYLSFNEQVFHPAKVQVIADRSWLTDFQRQYPSLAPLVSTLLRHYEGIYDIETSVHEKTLAFYHKTSVEEIRQQLMQLRFYGIIDYTPVLTTPQVYLLQDRLPPEAVTIDQEMFEKRKQTFINRVKAMIRYTQLTDMCRSQFISQYFGDQQTKPCGICDICKNQSDYSHPGKLHKKIIETLAEPLSYQSLKMKLHEVNELTLKRELHFLLEQKFISEKDGTLQINTPNE